MDIVVTGYAGSDGSCKIYQNMECRKKLLKRYSESFFGISFFGTAGIPARETGESLLRLDARFAAMCEQQLAVSAEEGGVLAALWRLLKQNHLGGCYDLGKIPVMQQTVEICETFGLNPYRLYAPSCRLWLTDAAGEIMGDAAGAGVPSAVIGFTAGGAAINRTDTEVPSSLRRPDKDEIFKVLPE